MLVVLVSAFILISLSLNDKAPLPNPFQEQLAQHRSVMGNQELVDAIDTLMSVTATFQEKSKQLDSLVSSNDPVAHDVLVRAVMSASTPELKTLIEKALLNRAKRLGAVLAAEEAQRVLAEKGSAIDPKLYEAIFRSLDGTAPTNARVGLLEKLYSIDARAGLGLSAAVALDEQEVDSYRPLIAAMVEREGDIDAVKGRSTLALMLVSKSVSQKFSEEVIRRRSEIPDADVLWTLRHLAKRGDINVRAMANIAIERGIVSKVRALFLNFLRDRGDLPQGVSAALVSAVIGEIGETELKAFGQWYDIAAEEVLFAIAVEMKDKSLNESLFDTIAGKSVNQEPVASIMAWIRRNHYEDRGRFVPLLGVLANADLVNPDRLKREFSVFDKYAKGSDLVRRLMDSNSSAIIQICLERYSDLVSIGDLLNLLGNESKGVRITAVKQLEGYNDVGGLKIIIDAYKREKDPEVKAAYKKSFWVIRQREESK